jgi:hypothetical protein
LNVGSGPLTVNATQKVSGSGTITSLPAVFVWRWYYHLPSLAFWMLALVPLVLISENRQLQAWAIVPALWVVLLGSRMLCNLFSVAPATAESFTGFIGTLATGWAIVWLVIPWLSTLPQKLQTGAALFLMIAVGLLSSAINAGTVDIHSLISDAVGYGLAAAVLLVPLELSSRFCRRQYAPRRLLLWLALLTTLLPVLIVIPAAILAAVLTANPMMLIAGLGTMLLAALAGGVLYLANLPFLFVAFRTELYRRRLCSFWRFEEPTAPATAVTGL